MVSDSALEPEIRHAARDPMHERRFGPGQTGPFGPKSDHNAAPDGIWQRQPARD